VSLFYESYNERKREREREKERDGRNFFHMHIIPYYLNISIVETIIELIYHISN